MSSYDVGGWIRFKGKKTARNQAELEKSFKALTLRVLVLVDTEFPGFEVETSSLAASQTLAERLKA
jgi:hypothetical protein